MTPTQFHALTGLSEAEGNQVLIEAFNKRMPVNTRLYLATAELCKPVAFVENRKRKALYDWPTRDLNLMALIVGVMSPDEWLGYLDAMRRIGKAGTAPEQFYESPFWGLQDDWEYWLLTADALTRACAAILALKLGRTVSAGEADKETN